MKINKLTCRAGSGTLYISNAIDSGDYNFFVGPVNLGYFLLNSNSKNIQFSIPGYLPADTYMNAILKGQGQENATLKGPFDDMEIEGEVIASGGSAVYPANTKNILQIVNVFQKEAET
ncbi:MAG: hypothetical protein MZV63_15030 [Marinilabiliales bacterium]|nr:hypothetical protein [Marinilabiliales bacterium]